MKNTNKIARSLIAGALLIAGFWAEVSIAAAPTPHAIVEQVTEQMKAAVVQNQHLVTADPEHYYNAVGAVLEPVVDFDFIATSVMGTYAQQATPEQRSRFRQVFKTGLISTYAKGMASFGELDVVVLPPDASIEGQKRVSVEQEVRGSDGKVNRITYTMGLNRDEQWKLINVVLNGVNLGKTFRGQFTQSMTRLSDIDAVINEWAAGSSVVKN